MSFLVERLAISVCEKHMQKYTRLRIFHIYMLLCFPFGMKQEKAAVAAAQKKENPNRVKCEAAREEKKK